MSLNCVLQLHQSLHKGWWHDVCLAIENNSKNQRSLVGWNHMKGCLTQIDGHFPRWTPRAPPPQPWPTPSPRAAPPGSTMTYSPPQSHIDLQKRQIRLNLKVFVFFYRTFLLQRTKFVYLSKYFLAHCWDILCEAQYNRTQYFLNSNILFGWIWFTKRTCIKGPLSFFCPYAIPDHFCWECIKRMRASNEFVQFEWTRKHWTSMIQG